MILSISRFWLTISNLNGKNLYRTRNSFESFLQQKNIRLVERIKFTSCFLNVNETVTGNVNRLRALAGDCSSGTGVDERLHDQLLSWNK